MQKGPSLYCTLFNSYYLSRGLAMLESLHRVQPDAQIAVFCFDSKTHDVLKALVWDFVIPVSMEAFENDALKKVKPTRTLAEYCWTSTPSTLAYCLEKLGFDHCTYLDADLFFYHSPASAFSENPNASVLITDHRYTPKYDQSATSGRYCVQFMYFEKNRDGLKVLHWWRDACLEWCYNRFEDGKFGDQKYLDDWTTRFTGVYDLHNEGIGTAPWNVQQYDVQKGPTLITSDGRRVPVIFYHFHALKLFENGFVDLGPYDVNESVRKYIYSPYLDRLLHWETRLSQEFGVHAPRAAKLGGLRILKRTFQRNLNYFSTKKLLKDAATSTN